MGLEEVLHLGDTEEDAIVESGDDPGEVATGNRAVADQHQHPGVPGG